MSNHSIHVSLYGEILLLPEDGGLSLELEDNLDYGENGGKFSLDDEEACALRDALLELYPLDTKKTSVGTVVVNVVPDTSDFGNELHRAIRLEVQRLAESAVDYAVKPAARQALANLAGAAELALAAVDD